MSDEIITKKKTVHMPFHHQVMNTLYDHPFVFITAMGMPFAGLVLQQQLKLQHLTISQRLMQTRVFAQGGIITLAMSTMMFREYMDRRGRFPEPDDK